jgi:hypothetical protein
MQRDAPGGLRHRALIEAASAPGDHSTH